MRKHWGFLTAHMITELTWGIITILQCPSESFEEMESNANFKAFLGRLGKTLWRQTDHYFCIRKDICFAKLRLIFWVFLHRTGSPALLCSEQECSGVWDCGHAPAGQGQTLTPATRQTGGAWGSRRVTEPVLQPPLQPVAPSTECNPAPGRSLVKKQGSEYEARLWNLNSVKLWIWGKVSTSFPVRSNCVQGS